MAFKVIIEKSRGEGSLMEQPQLKMFLSLIFFLNFVRKKITSFYAKNVFTVYNVFKFFFVPENMKKPASKVAEPAQISIPDP